MSAPSQAIQSTFLPALNRLSDNVYLASVRAGMVAIMPLTIIGGLFLILAFFPSARWQAIIAPYAQLLQVPVTATFGLLALFVCFAVAYELAKHLKQDPLTSAFGATLGFLLLSLKLSGKEITLNLESLGSKGLFTAIIIAVCSVRIHKFFTDQNLVIRLPKSVPEVVYESFVSLVPTTLIVVTLWGIRFLLGFDINSVIQKAFSPLVFALNTLPGILVYAFLVTLLWSVGINGDNTLDAVVAPVFLDYLASNVDAITKGLPAPYITANGFFTTFVNVGGTGATIALALLMLNSRDPGYRKISRLSLPTQIFGINEPIFFGFPIVLNPIFMIPYITSALVLTASSYLLMSAGLIGRPIINIPWTTPPIVGHYLATGGDWRAAVWGLFSILLAMLIYFPFARAAERQRLAAPALESAPKDCQ